MVVDRRAREPGRGDEVGGASGAASDEREDLDALRIGERAAEREQPILARALSREVGDQPDDRCCASTSGSVGSRWGMRTTRSASGSGT